MSSFDAHAGRYQGAPRIRPGAEGSLSATETKGLLRNAAPTALVLRPDGSFLYRGAIEGRYEIEDDILLFQPVSFDGQTLEAMRSRAEEAQRSFGLAWIFEPFRLVVEAPGILVSVSPGVVQTVFTPAAEPPRKGRPPKQADGEH